MKFLTELNLTRMLVIFLTVFLLFQWNQKERLIKNFETRNAFILCMYHYGMFGEERPGCFIVHSKKVVAYEYGFTFR